MKTFFLFFNENSFVFFLLFLFFNENSFFLLFLFFNEDLDEDLFWSSTKIRGKIPLSLVFNWFDIATANFLPAQGATAIERL